MNGLLVTTLKAIELNDFESAPQAIQLIQGALSLNSSSIHDQVDFLNSFTSTVDIYNTTIKDAIENKPIMEIIDSDIVLNDFRVKNINLLESDNMILITSSTLVVSNLVYSESASTLFYILSSNADLDGVTFENITTSQELIQIHNCKLILMF